MLQGSHRLPVTSAGDALGQRGNIGGVYIGLSYESRGAGFQGFRGFDFWVLNSHSGFLFWTSFKRGSKFSIIILERYSFNSPYHLVSSVSHHVSSQRNRGVGPREVSLEVLASSTS